MPLEVKKQERETSQSLLRRFSKGMQESGILIRARKLRFKQREKSRQIKKQLALRREIKRKQEVLLKKLGERGKDAKKKNSRRH